MAASVVSVINNTRLATTKAATSARDTARVTSDGIVSARRYMARCPICLEEGKIADPTNQALMQINATSRINSREELDRCLS